MKEIEQLKNALADEFAIIVRDALAKSIASELLEVLSKSMNLETLHDDELDEIYMEHHDDFGNPKTAGFRYERDIIDAYKEKNGLK